MYKLVVILFFLFGCSNSSSEINLITNSTNEVRFDVVEKAIFFEQSIPDNVKKYVEMWFNEKVKVDGFDGKILFSINDYHEKIYNIEDGKKIEVTMTIFIKKETNNKLNSKNYSISIKEFSSITGDFSINDLDALKINTQKNLIIRLSKNIESKI